MIKNKLSEIWENKTKRAQNINKKSNYIVDFANKHNISWMDNSTPIHKSLKFNKQIYKKYNDGTPIKWERNELFSDKAVKWNNKQFGKGIRNINVAYDWLQNEDNRKDFIIKYGKKNINDEPAVRKWKIRNSYIPRDSYVSSGVNWKRKSESIYNRYK